MAMTAIVQAILDKVDEGSTICEMFTDIVTAQKEIEQYRAEVREEKNRIMEAATAAARAESKSKTKAAALVAEPVGGGGAAPPTVSDAETAAAKARKKKEQRVVQDVLRTKPVDKSITGGKETCCIKYNISRTIDGCTHAQAVANCPRGDECPHAHVLVKAVKEENAKRKDTSSENTNLDKQD